MFLPTRDTVLHILGDTPDDEVEKEDQVFQKRNKKKKGNKSEVKELVNSDSALGKT